MSLRRLVVLSLVSLALAACGDNIHFGPTVVSLDVTPIDPSIALGTTVQLHATATAGLADAIAVGTVTISASLDNVTGATGLTVTAVSLVAIQVTPGTPTIANGSTVQFTATGVFSDSSRQNLTAQATWTSSMP